jgi:hypothetical protein
VIVVLVIVMYMCTFEKYTETPTFVYHGYEKDKCVPNKTTVSYYNPGYQTLGSKYYGNPYIEFNTKEYTPGNFICSNSEI